MKTIRFQRLLTACSVMLFFLAAACTKEPSTSPAKTQDRRSPALSKCRQPVSCRSPSDSPAC